MGAVISFSKTTEPEQLSAALKALFAGSLDDDSYGAPPPRPPSSSALLLPPPPPPPYVPLLSLDLSDCSPLPRDALSLLQRGTDDAGPYSGAVAPETAARVGACG